MWFDQPTNQVLYSPDNALKAASACADARQLPNGYALVPARLENLQRLTKAGLTTPAPMAGYDWPAKGGRKPWEVQRITANFLVLNPRAFVLNDMGTGKTLSALWAADFIMRQHPPGTCRCLIVTPLSTMRRTWGDELFANFLGRRTFEFLHGTAKQRMEGLSRPADFYIVNHDGVGVGASSDRKTAFIGFAEELQRRTDLRICIIDEASAYRDATSKRHRVARALLQPRDYLWLLSGTPTSNGPTDAYGLAKLVNGAYGISFAQFKSQVMYQASQFKWLPKIDAQRHVARMLSPAVRYALEDCQDIPPCTVTAREADMSPEQNAAFKQLKKDYTIQVKSGQTITAVSEGVLRLKLIQIACGAIYDSNHDVHTLNPEPRLRVLEEIIEEAPHKVIIFAPLTSVLKLIYSRLSKHSRALINGQTSLKERSDIIGAFQEDEEPRVLIADPGTMSHGLTLTRASTIVWYCPVDKTEQYIQANARINRPGQLHKTQIVQLSASKIEREIFRRLEANETMQGVLLEMMEDK